MKKRPLFGDFKSKVLSYENVKKEYESLEGKYRKIGKLSKFDDSLKEEGIYEKVDLAAQQRVADYIELAVELCDDKN